MWANQPSAYFTEPSAFFSSSLKVKISRSPGFGRAAPPEGTQRSPSVSFACGLISL